MSSEKVAVVTGANKGIGFGIVKTLCERLNPADTVYLTARDEARGLAATTELENIGFHPKFHLLDIDSQESTVKFKEFLIRKHGGIDILVNNAAIFISTNDPMPFGAQAERTIQNNYFGTLRICQEFFPLLRKGARVVNISSSEGHLTRQTYEQFHKV